MNTQRLKDTLANDLRKASTWLKAGLLAALPFAGEIKQTVSDNLPALQPYLPENIYKFMGGAVVVGGMVLSLAKSYRTVKAAE